MGMPCYLLLYVYNNYYKEKINKFELDTSSHNSQCVCCAIFQVVLPCIKVGLYRIWCGVNRLGDSGVHTLGYTSAFVNPVGQLLLTWRCKIRIDGVGIVLTLQGSYWSWKTWKVMEFLDSRSGKSWNLCPGHGKSWNLMLANVCIEQTCLLSMFSADRTNRLHLF